MPTTNTPLTTMNYQGPRRSLILAGGGVRLAYQAGVAQALQENGLQFNHVDGTSGGIFNTAMLASGVSPNEMADNWRQLKIKYFMSSLPLKSYLKPFRLNALGDADGIRNGVFPGLGIDVEKIRNNGEFRATFNVCNFSDKTVESIPHDQVTEDFLIAGVSLPVFMPALWINNAWYSDAVWIKDANLMEAVRRGAEELWLVWAIGNSRAYFPGSFNQYVHMIEMSANGGLFEEFQQIMLVNEQIKNGNSPYGQKEPIRLHVIKPEYPLPLDPDLFLGKIDTRTLINMGYADTNRYLSGLTTATFVSDFSTSATKMNEPGASFHLRQCFQGKINMNNADHRVSLYTALTIRKWEDHFDLSINTSIYLDVWEREVSAYDDQVNLEEPGLVSTSTFRRDQELYKMKVTMPLHSTFDWFLGLEFRTAELELLLVSESSEKSLAKCRLSQSFASRIRMLWHSNLNDPAGKHRRKTKRKLIQYLYKK